MKNCNHERLKEIYRSVLDYEDQSCEVIRWCPACGAVVIDTDIDNRTSPGDVLEMQFPDLKY